MLRLSKKGYRKIQYIWEKKIKDNVLLVTLEPTLTLDWHSKTIVDPQAKLCSG